MLDGKIKIIAAKRAPRQTPPAPPREEAVKPVIPTQPPADKPSAIHEPDKGPDGLVFAS